MAGQGRGGNEGCSGTALWKVKQQYASQLSALPLNQPIQKVDLSPPLAPNVLVDAVSLGGSADTQQKPLVRHVLIRNLEKAARVLKFRLPTTGIFADKAPVGLSALFDGQSCAGEPGPLAAEFCAKNFHVKLLEALSQLEANQLSENFIKAVLIQCFEDLDSDLLASDPDLKDGCGAAVSLMIGETLFTLQLGQCSSVLCEMVEGQPKAVPLGGDSSIIASQAERLRLQLVGALVVGDDKSPRVRLPNGTLSSVSRSFGDRMWKGTAVGGMGLPVIKCEPTVGSVKLRGADSHPYVFLCSSSVAVALRPQQLVDLSRDFQFQPRAACGEVALQALEANAGLQCTAVQVCFLPAAEKKDESAPPSKKAKTMTSAAGTKSMRLRHILVKYLEVDAKGNPISPQTDAKDKGKPPTRLRAEAEAVLRGAIHELRKDSMGWKRKPKSATDLVELSSPKFCALARALSECQSGKQGGSMCGDLGWVTPEQRTTMGTTFKDVTEVLVPGSWSDIVTSNQGLHLVQRLA